MRAFKIAGMQAKGRFDFWYETPGEFHGTAFWEEDCLMSPCWYHHGNFVMDNLTSEHRKALENIVLSDYHALYEGLLYDTETGELREGEIQVRVSSIAMSVVEETRLYCEGTIHSQGAPVWKETVDLL
jgi:hypothetical protein